MPVLKQVHFSLVELKIVPPNSVWKITKIFINYQLKYTILY